MSPNEDRAELAPVSRRAADQVITVTRSARPKRGRRKTGLDGIIESLDQPATKFIVASLALVIVVLVILKVAQAWTEREQRLSRGEVSEPASRQSAPIGELTDGGHRLEVASDGAVAGLDKIPPSDADRIRDALVTQRIAPPPVLNSILHRKTLITAPSPLVSPVWTAITTDSPRFRWSKVEGASRYTVRVYTEEFLEVMGSEPVTATEWQATKPLPRERTYFWHVTSATPDGRSVTSPEARFLILEQTESRRVNQLSTVYRDRPLTLGLLLAQSGVRDLAEEQLLHVVQANPDNTLADKLLASLRQW